MYNSCFTGKCSENLVMELPVFYVYGILSLSVSELRCIPCPRYKTAAENFLFWI